MIKTTAPTYIALIVCLLCFFRVECQTDPCLEYLEGTNHCKKCSEGLIFALIDESTTLCASSDKNTCILDDTYYGQSDHFHATFEYVTTQTDDHQYCFNCTTFFALPDGRNKCYADCPKHVPFSSSEITIDEKSVGCHVCALEEYQMQAVLDYNFINLSVKTCSETIENTACTFMEYYDFEEKRCVACLDKYQMCAACNQERCIVGSFMYYYDVNFYNYSSNKFEIDKMVAVLCKSGNATTVNGNECIPSTWENCPFPFIDYGAVEKCLYCSPGYKEFNQSCVRFPEPPGNFTYFIRSGTPYHVDDFYEDIFPSDMHSIDKPLYFLGMAIQHAVQKADQYQHSNATFYIGKGEHFFFYCNNLTGGMFNAPQIIRYCKDYEHHLSQDFVYQDNVTYIFQPLYCSLGSALGLEANINFQDMCVQEGIDPNPLIYANQAYGFFEIFKSATFQNLRFSGINQLVQPVIASNDFSVIPKKFCNIVREPEVGEEFLELEVNYEEDFNILYKCINVNFTGSQIPQGAQSSSTCERNRNEHFYPEPESTFSCSGEPSYYYYYYGDRIEIGSKATDRRVNTLFDLISFPEYMTGHDSPITLNIINCTFEYFLTNYESLINVQNANIQYMDLVSYFPHVQQLEAIIYNNIGERGGKITIQNSVFKHSSFCKGLIVYRKQLYLDNDQRNYGNFSYILMTKPFLNDSGSYIVIEGSRFTNINSAFQNISALALYGGQEVWRKSVVVRSSMKYQGFVNRGSILNVEDFGGYIHISNCTFEYNMHFIPSIYNAPVLPSQRKSISDFIDKSSTKELKLAICDQNTNTDKFFFSHGLSEADDIEAMYDTFERLSTVYISRNRDAVIIENNTFHSNIGTFGGAISVNSQNWVHGGKPYLMIRDNNFTNNMAYFSGNAVYVRNSVLLKDDNPLCGGVEMTGNNFQDNTGGSIYGNGGAASISCKLLEDDYLDDFFSSSSQYFDNPQQAKEEQTLFTNPHTKKELLVQKFTVNMENNTFTHNLAGAKGTALFIKNVNSVKITNCVFEENGPLLSQLEVNKSPYVKYLSHRSLIFPPWSVDCENEFEYLEHCQTGQAPTLKWSHVYGAVYVEHCQTSSCYEAFAVMDFQLHSSTFENNSVGYIMDAAFPSDLSSQIQIVGGLNNTIHSCTFNSLKGIYQHLLPTSLKESFPDSYFDFQQGSLISILGDFLGNEERLLINELRNCTFHENRHFQVLGLGSGNHYQGSLIRISSPNSLIDTKPIQVLKITNSSIIGNSFFGEKASLVYSQNSLIQIEDCLFNMNGGTYVPSQAEPLLSMLDDSTFGYVQEYGILYMDGIQKFLPQFTHLILNNTFINTYTQKSAILQVNFGNQFLNMTGNRLENNMAVLGGLIAMDGTTDSLLEGEITLQSQNMNSTLLFDSNTFWNQITLQGVFSCMISNKLFQLNLLIRNCEFVNNFQQDDYSLISLENVKKVVIQESQFMAGTYSTALKEEIISGLVQETNQYLEQLAESVFGEKYDLYFLGNRFLSANSSQNSEAVLYFSTHKILMSEVYYEHMEVIDCDFENFNTLQSGAIAKIAQDSKLLIMNSLLGERKIVNSRVGENGIIFSSGSNFAGINLNISDSESATSTCLLYLTLNSMGLFQNSSFSKNQAQTYGMVYLTGSSYFYCDYCEFTENQVEMDTSIIYADNNPQGYVGVNNSHFSLNNASSNLISLVSTRTVIENSSFRDNFAQLITHGITVTNADLTLRNVFVDYTDDEFLNNNKLDVDVCFFNVNFRSLITIENSLFQNCRGQNAGLLKASGFSEVIIRNNSRFVNNWSSLTGELAMLKFTIITAALIQDSYFEGNGAIDVIIEKTPTLILNSTFTHGYAQSISAAQSNIEIVNSMFKDTHNYEGQGASFYCKCQNLTITNTTFSNLSAAQGGALYLSASSEESVFLIDNNTFSENSAQQGGAIYVSDAPILHFQRNIFENNRAEVIDENNLITSNLPKKGLGGGIFFQCQNNEQGLYNNCQYELTDNNLFVGNYAENDGGGIQQASNDIILDDSNTFDSNQAFYGNDLATYPSHLQVVFLENNDYHDPINITESFMNGSLGEIHNTKFEKLVSGNPMSFVIYIKDQNQGIYYTDNESTATLKNADPSIEVLLKGNEAKSNNGMFSFSEFTAIIEPGSNLTLKLEISGMYDFGMQIPFLETQLELELSFRTCVPGEQMLNYACEQCPKDQYLLEVPTENEKCKTCDHETSICEGGNIIFPQKSYWRNSSMSEDWIQCPRVSSCLEGDRDHLTSNCAVGYEGIVCGKCSQGFSKTGDFQCGKCPNKTKNIVKILFILLVVILLVIGLVYSAMTSVGKVKSKSSVYIKIMTSHLQIISALANVTFTWPYYIESLYLAMVSISKMSEQMFSFDCFLEEASTAIVTRIGTYFTKLLLYALLPVILSMTVLVFWLVVLTCKRQLKNFGSYFVSTIVILLFLVHPTITQAMFQAFNCVNIGGVYYLRDDIEYECYKGQHLRFLVIIVIPSVIIWCIGIPLFALIQLMKNKELFLKEGRQEELTEEERAKMALLKIKYGFIFNGFKYQAFYYEVVIQYRKVLLIMITVILSVVSPEIQALLSFLVLIVSMLFQYSNKPFLTDILNRMEMLSLLISSTTLYSGMYFITGQHYDYYESKALQWIFFTLLLVPNVAFFVYWLFFMFIELLIMAIKRKPMFFCILTLGLSDPQRFKIKYMEQKVAPGILEPDQSKSQFELENSNQLLLQTPQMQEKKKKVIKKPQSRRTLLEAQTKSARETNREASERMEERLDLRHKLNKKQKTPKKADASGGRGVTEREEGSAREGPPQIKPVRIRKKRSKRDKPPEQDLSSID